MNIPQVNRTARTKGAVGPNALIPRIIKASALPEGIHVLDFGSGPDAAHAAELRKCGYTVTAYEVGKNVRDGVHNPDALNYEYEVVFASNVLNVQRTAEDVEAVLRQLRSATAAGGQTIFNYPLEPRHNSLTGEQFLAIVEEVFDHYLVVNANVEAPVVVAHVPLAFE